MTRESPRVRRLPTAGTGFPPQNKRDEDLKPVDAGAAEWRERQRQRAEARSVGLDPDRSYVLIAADEDESAPLDLDGRPIPARKCEHCGKELPVQTGPGVRRWFCNDAHRKAASRKAAQLATIAAAGMVPAKGMATLPEGNPPRP